MSVDDTPRSYPVTLDATLDRPSRGLWLVKWLLLIPHYVVLGFLMIGLVVVWVAAFFAVLVTGRYPRPLFDYTVGVLRWTWRVTAYGYGLGGTDRYPPFTFADVPDYPAHLDVAYPERLSRGLVLVKWWLLAIPHYIITSLLYGGLITYTFDENGSRTRWDSTGIIGLLVFVALIVLLVRAVYPSSMFDLITGLQRWGYRVAGYALLLTDAYPPFRLDMGGTDPAHAEQTPETPAWVATAPPPPPLTPVPDRWTAGRITALVAGAVLVLTSGAVLLGAGTTAVAGASARDDDGYLSTGRTTVSSTGYAVTTEAFETPGAGPYWASPSWALGTLRARVTGDDPGRPVFLGVAQRADVDRYLAGVEHATVRELNGSTPMYDLVTGTAVPAAPGAQSFWVSHAEGTGPLEVTWSADTPSWVLVVMPADTAAPGVRVSADVGATLPVLGRITAGLAVGGFVLLALGALLMVVAFRPGSAPTGPRAVTTTVDRG